jgi:hypothetical protein
MSFVRTVAVVAVFAAVATVVPARTVLAGNPDASDAHGFHTLTLTVDTLETERGTGDTGFPGLTKGDTYVSNGKVRSVAGQVVGTYHVACTVTDELDENGSAWTLCSTATVIDGRGTLLASGLTELLNVETSGNGYGVAPPTADFALVGGTGSFAGAIGQVTSTRDASLRTLHYRFKLAPIPEGPPHE